MAHSKSAMKRLRQSLEARSRNRSRRTQARHSVRAVREAVHAGDADAVAKALSSAYSSLDLAAKNGAIHTGTADRTKRRLAALAGTMSSAG
jgi:small subunit ribosomal protein S20